MNRAIFGRRPASPPANRIERILIPRGAAASADDWALSEALQLFVYAATDRALFESSELPPDAIAVMRVYDFAGDLHNFTISGWFSSATPGRPADETVHGLRVLGETETADLLQDATQMWNSSASLTGAERTERMARFAVVPDRWEALTGECSRWVRESPLTTILGDGRLDTVYKETMKQLYRCNRHYADRRKAVDERRVRLGLAAVGPPALGPCTLGELIAEMQRAFG